MLVVDTNTDCTAHTTSLKVRGVTHIGRYYASSKWKRISPAEAKALSNAGFKLVAIFEDSSKPPLTVEAGEHDARIALTQAQAAGQPPGTPIYFAMENLPNGYNATHLSGLKAYFKGVANVLASHYAIGAYSNGLSLATLLDAGAIQYAWVSASTSFVGSKDFLKTKRWHLAQRLIDKDWDGVSVDTNDCQGDFGAWALAARDAIDEATRQLMEAPTVGAVAATVTASVPQAVASVATVPEDKSGLMDRFAPNASKVEELANQGSRTGQALRDISAMFGKFWGALLALLGLGSQVDPAKGPAHDAGSWGSAHPFLLAFLCITVTALLITGFVYWKNHKAQKGLAAAANDGRYQPRGAPA